MPGQYPLKGKRVWVAGHRGMVGSAIVRALQGIDCQVLTTERDQLDLLRQAETERWIATHRPQAVFLAAAKVGGIGANDRYPADFLYQNLIIETNVIAAAHAAGVEKLLFLGSSCIYPREAPQPIGEDALLTGPLETTNEWYALAKIAGIKLCEAYRKQHGANFISAMPTNLYGPGDNFHPDNSHVLPALLRRVHEAKRDGMDKVTLWGSGTALREFMHVDDLAQALLFMMQHYDGVRHLNIGHGEEVSILDLARRIAAVVGWDGTFELDRSKPDGTPRKLMDSSRLHALGWRPRIGLDDGLASTYAWFQATPTTREA